MDGWNFGKGALENTGKVEGRKVRQSATLLPVQGRGAVVSGSRGEERGRHGHDRDEI